MRSSEGIDWGGKVILEDQTTVAPILTALGDRMYLGFTGRPNQQRQQEGLKLNIRRSADGIDWR
jgi:hypothetical protein